MYAYIFYHLNSTKTKFSEGELLVFSKRSVRSILMKNMNVCSHRILSTPSGSAVMRSY